MRWLGVLLLFLAATVVVFDGVAFLSSGGDWLRSAGDWWFRLHPSSLQLAQPAVERYVLPELWDPVIIAILRWPLAIILAVVGVVFLLLGIRWRRRGKLFQ